MEPPVGQNKMDAHSARVSTLAAQIRAFHAQGIGFRCYHGGTTSTRRVTYSSASSVDLSGFTSVLSVNGDSDGDGDGGDSDRAMTARVEPNVSMAALVRATLPLGLVPAVVPEFTTITAGGCFAGSGGESSSSRHGLFDHTVSEVEMVLGDGTVVVARRGLNEDLWRGAAGSYGSLGVVTLLEIKLVPAKGFVEVEYVGVGGTEEALRMVDDAEGREDVRFCDAILFSETKGVVMLGRWRAGREGEEGVRFTRRGDEWFYMHAEKVTNGLLKGDGKDRKDSGSSSPASRELAHPRSRRVLIPTYDYLFRYDRACFWTGHYALHYFYVHNIRFSRWLGDSLLRPRTMMHALQKSGLANQYVVQDIGIPYQHVSEFVSHIQREIGIYPLWLCPLLRQHDEWPLMPNDTDVPEKLMNVGLWGRGSKKLPKFVEQNRSLELKARALHGWKCLYAQAYYPEEEFWEMYSKPRYEALRKKYRAETLPTVFEKVCKNSALAELEKRGGSSKERLKGVVKDFWICRGVYGAASAALGGDYLMRKVKSS